MHHRFDAVEPEREEALVGLELELSGMMPAALAIMPSLDTMA